MEEDIKGITQRLVKQPLAELAVVHSNPRPWHMPVLAAVCAGLPPLLQWAVSGQLEVVALLGANVILNLPSTGSLMYRMAVLLSCACSMVLCFALGLIGHLVTVASLPLLAMVVFWLALFSRYFRLPPPAGTFMLMAMAVALYIPCQVEDVPRLTGLFALGACLSVLLGLIYSLIMLYQRPASPTPAAGYQPNMVVFSGLVATCVTISLAVAWLLGLPRPYWVPITCYVIIQGIDFQSIWTKHVHRIVGTTLGLAVAWLVLGGQMSPWYLIAVVMIMVFCIETLVVRHYAAAVAVITPYTILLAELSSHGQMSSSVLMAGRFWDTVLGSVLGAMGGWLLLNSPLVPRLQPLEHKLLGWFAAFDQPKSDTTTSNNR